MALDKKLELLDSYIANKMSPTERASFEQDIQADPTLLQEFHLQQEIIEGIRKARVAELKAMLSNVAIPTGGISEISTTTKVILGALGVAAIATTAFFLTRSETPATTPSEEFNKESVMIITEPNEETDVTIEPSTQKESSESSDVIEKERVALPKNNEGTSSTKTSSTLEKEASKVIKPSFDTFDSEDASEKSEAAPINHHSEVKAPVASSKIVAETDNTNKKYKFHYQLQSDRLILYGDFENSLYEIIEVFNENKVTAFLYFKDSYYLLTEDAGKIKQLLPITDEVLLQKLKEYQQR